MKRIVLDTNIWLDWLVFRDSSISHLKLAVEGKRAELSGRLQQRYGYAKDQAEREIDDWLRTTT